MIPFQVKLIGLFVLVVATSLIAWRVHNHIDRGGYARCQTEHTLAATAAKDKARTNIVKVGKANEAKLKAIHSTADSGYGVGPITTRVIDGLQ